MTLIEFLCERCEAALKVRTMLAGRTIQCPKCGRKTTVPKLGEAEAADAGATTTAAVPAGAASAPAAVAQPPAETVSLRPSTAPGPAPAAPPAAAALPEPAEAVAPVRSAPHVPVDMPGRDDLEQKKREAQIKQLEAKLAEAERVAEQAQREASRLRAAASEHEQAATRVEAAGGVAELEAARSRILELEGRQEILQKQLKETREALADGVALPASAVSFDDDAEADAMLAELRTVSFSKMFRAAVLLHVIVILVTSMGYFLRMWQHRSAASTVAAESASAPVAERAAPVRTPEPPAAVPQTMEPERAAAPQRPLSDIERRVQELPEPGELPVSPSADLNF